ncbi:hypothetical protein R69927_05653 [Paraburkholderia domus]|jgi:hypothetical protein|uniref:ATP-binding protein n=1 Tax=Paraburkholderia domus TaxID=2793075 RepID=UPI001913BE02|nr:ATP-binding protein [Paraburkholderia domus]MBK5050792.1 ATP-binding protein [Burkholderia sp. R-70006]MBK5089871.1 ATP-binding protein [Burkholderia sp. R-69927]CAE6766138.1 hypothetical protein R70006_03729 [Paraburkholderia domus]CAE6905574.1 hypothetical protein R69927_05653 [Paraburkholderia domus]
MKRRNGQRAPDSGHTAQPPGGEQVPQDVLNDPIFALTRRYVDAVYHDSALELPEYAGNPLILALPPFVDLDATLAALAKRFAVSCPDGCGSWSKEYRLMAIGRIDRLLVILPVHVSLLQWIHTALRNHFVRYNPGVDIHQMMQAAYEKVQSGKPGVIADLVEGHAACRALIGMSGTGKSTAMKLVLSLFSPMIRHPDFRNPECHFWQLVWVYVTCPANGSVLNFLKDILRWVDQMLDTHYLSEMRTRDNSGDYGAKVATVLTKYYTGLLIIDEFQNLLKAAATTELLDTVVNLLNSGCCCMMVMGTPEVERIIQTRLRLARRVSSDGYELLLPFRDGEVYQNFVDRVLALNFLEKPVKDLKNVRSVILGLSAGLPAVIKLLFRLAQIMAIETRREQITSDLLAQVQHELLAPLSGIVQALRKQDSIELAKYVDVLNGAATEAYGRALSGSGGTGGEDFHDQVRNQTFAAAVAALLALGVTESDADQWVNQVLRETPTLTSYGVVLEVLRRVEKSQSPTKPPKAP